MSQGKDDGYMVTIHVPGWRLGLEGLSTEGADVQVGVWPEQQQAGQDAHQRTITSAIYLYFCLLHTKGKVFPLLEGLESSFWGQIGVEFNFQSTGAHYRWYSRIRAAH